MEDIIYSVTINAPKQQVWDIMLGKNTYSKWVKGFSQNSQLVGQWKQGTEVDFIDVDKGGTRAFLEVVDEPNQVVAKHIAVLDKDRNLQTKGMENWIGTIEEYQLTEEDGKTTLTILMHSHSDYREMMDAGWETSLELLKKLCEE